MSDFSNIPAATASDDLQVLAALARDLAALKYTVDGVEALLGAEAYAAFARDQPVPALLKTRDDDGALAAVVRLWLLAEPIPRAAVNTALPETGVEALLALRLIEPAGPVADCETVRAAVDLRPYGWPAQANAADEANNGKGGHGTDLWVASDLAAHQRPGVLRHDHVLGIGQASLTLAQSIVRRPVETALDLGTGCGIQTFHLLEHAQHVVATDISVRALAFTRFNVLLNAAQLGIQPENLQARVDLRLGSLLEPVAGETFELVISNPPFVITPRSSIEDAADRFTYRDGGLAGDELVAALVRGLPDVLAAGGTAQLLGNWEIPSGASWSAAPESWIREGTDAWFIQREQVSPGQYAETWLQDASQNRDLALYGRSYAAYLADFASRDVSGIGFGLIWLRSPAPLDGVQGAERISRFEEILYPIEQPVGPHLGAAVDRADWLAGLAPDALPQTRLIVAPDVTEERHQRPGAEHPGVILLRQGAGLRRTNLLSTELAGFVSVCDGDLTVGQIIAALATFLDRRDDGGAENGGAENGGAGHGAANGSAGHGAANGSAENGGAEGQFMSGLLHGTRNLIRDGFLLPCPPN
ncbi:DUF7059 domain-containing protein [Arthrobacter sp. H14-L1]|uniref:DUF7059 domain-containing protein n=1 Tax=Arthrobacter sp. H14-L1 TaxID=2996697 RepID=UPI00226D6C65|nr:methyltransferase [Arthrobacter sp. H14-L1]MCY0904011.1 methyltransferase [Arthrobacter sp. H14-L1]